MFPCHMTLTQEADSGADLTKPVFVAGNTVTSTSTGDINISKPTGTAAGDLMIMCCALNDNVNNTINGAGTGDTDHLWISFGNQTSGSQEFETWWRYVGEDETLSNTESVNVTNAGSDEVVIAIQTWRQAAAPTSLATNTTTSPTNPATITWTEPAATDGLSIICGGDSSLTQNTSITDSGTPAPDHKTEYTSFDLCHAWLLGRFNNNRGSETLGKTMVAHDCCMRAVLVPFGGDGVSVVGTDGPDESSAGTDITLTIPGSPQPGDIMIVNQSGDSTASLSDITGWTELGSQLNTGALDMRTWWKVFEEGDTTVVVPFSGGGARYNMASMIVLRGVTIPKITGETGLGGTINTTVTAHDNSTAFNEADSAGYTIICGAVGDTGAATTLTTAIGSGSPSTISADHSNAGSNFIWYRANSGATSQTGGMNSSGSADSLIRVISCSAIKTGA